ncbi:hypothetical protein NBRC116590_38710 [Pelagimonas sp. KU-00592-HH]|uniref:hypothetical protein n=1 Tax=Pelagimonas sp. KU-00592-HH TaxID=3127651 RepID=UPI00310750DB
MPGLLAYTLLFMTAGSMALSCTFDGSFRFEPDLQNWRPFDEAGEYLGSLPAPSVRVLEVKRGKEPAGMTCDDAGTISVSVSLPEGTRYSLKDLGVYFRTIGGTAPDIIFPSSPVVGEINGSEYRFLFAWLDGHPSQQIPIDLEVEIFFVAKDLALGASVLQRIRAEIGIAQTEGR